MEIFTALLHLSFLLLNWSKEAIHGSIRDESEARPSLQTVFSNEFCGFL